MSTGRLFLAVAAVSLVKQVGAQTAAQAPVRHPDFVGIWSSATTTPLERPAEFKDQQFFTPEEAKEVQTGRDRG